MALTTQELQRRLWQAADILRGQIDSADYKNYIFSMLFLKRLSDRFDEEVEAAVAAGVPREAALADMDEHQFAVPPEAHWNQICSTPMNLGDSDLRVEGGAWGDCGTNHGGPGASRRLSTLHGVPRHQPEPARQGAGGMRAARAMSGTSGYLIGEFADAPGVGHDFNDPGPGRGEGYTCNLLAARDRQTGCGRWHS